MLRPALLTAMLALAAAPATADEILDSMREAQRAYEAGKAAEARMALEEALQLLAQRAAAGLAEALPAPLSGWQAEEAETQASAAGVFGGTQASRTYRNAEDQTVEISLTSDSPLVAQLAALMTNPAMAGAMGRLVRVGSQRAIQSEDGQIQMLVNNRVLVTVSGDAPPEAKMAYARAIDLSKLTAR